MKNVGSRRGRGEREVNRALEGFARVTMSRYLRRGNVIEEENVGFYSDWSEKRDGRTAAVETSYGGTNGASLVQWRNVSFVYIYIQNKGGSTSRHPALRRDRFSKYRSVEGKRRCSWNFDENTLRHSLLRSSSSTRCLKTRWIMEFVPNSLDPIGISEANLSKLYICTPMIFKFFIKYLLILTYFDRWRNIGCDDAMRKRRSIY